MIDLQKIKKKTKIVRKTINHTFTIINLENSIFVIFCIYIIYKSIKIKNIQIEKDKFYPYFFCYAAMGKGENRYAREVLEYYKKLGVDKFIFADNNDKNSEKFSDIFQKEISDGLIEIIDIRGKIKNQMELYADLYEIYNSKCRWMSFYDFDEFLEIKKNNKTLTIKDYLSAPNFQKCDVIINNWLSYNDNELIKYDKRPVLKRFTKPLYNSISNRFIKSIVKGNIRFNPWSNSVSCHRPQHKLRTCDSYGNRAKTFNDVLWPPQLDFAYIKHYLTKSTEEYAERSKKGHPFGESIFYDERVYNYFLHNIVTEEKVRFFEKIFNQTFPKYHYVFKKN